MRQTLGLVSLVVPDYDEALGHYVDDLGFELAEDTRISEDKRWVVVRPRGGETGLLLALAANDRQRAAVGDQCGGRVFLFLQTDDFRWDYARQLDRGLRFEEEPRNEPYGRVAVFRDRYGNRWDLIGPASPREAKV